MPAAMMMAAPSPVSVLQYIDTAVAVATFLVSERLPATIETIKRYFSHKGKEEPTEKFAEKSQGLIQLLVIDPGLLSTLKDKIKSAIEAYKACLSTASRPQENDACDRRAERDICDTLNRIKSRNNGVLPDHELDNQWQSFGCVAV